MDGAKSGQMLERAVIGCLLGTAVGDAIGLPMEGLPAKRLAKLFPEIGGHQLLMGRGMYSDDTEHTCMVAQALICSRGDVEPFMKSFSRHLRIWLACLPAGAGRATIKAILKLWMGVSYEHSGVFSAGNGPAMRSAIIGVCFGEDYTTLRKMIKGSTRITHTDPKAEYGALAVALAAQMARAGTLEPEDYSRVLCEMLRNDAPELIELVNRVSDSVLSGETTASFADGLGLGLGVSGYAYHTVPVALHACLRHPADYRQAVVSVIKCGGDTDTTAAIVGGIVGASVGEDGIPAQWLSGLVEWPRGVGWIREMGRQLAIVSGGGTGVAPPVPVAGVVIRNLLFLMVVLGHGFRRLLPPY